ncbi:hypothetical protein C8Q70DRAFT_912019, partial [Cubamyces menziesii]
RLVHTAIRALIYEVNETKPHLVLLACRDDWDPACGCQPHPEDLDTDPWFARREVPCAIDYLPGTRCRLNNGYHIISVPPTSRPHSPNQTLRNLFSVEWAGTIVVVKRGRRHRAHAVHITPPEVSLINAVVERFVHGELLPRDAPLTMCRWIQSAC